MAFEIVGEFPQRARHPFDRRQGVLRIALQWRSGCKHVLVGRIDRCARLFDHLARVRRDLAVQLLEQAVGALQGAVEILANLVERNLVDLVDDVGDLLLDLVEARSEEHTSELQSLMRTSYAVFCLQKTTNTYKYYYLHKYK